MAGIFVFHSGHIDTSTQQLSQFEKFMASIYINTIENNSIMMWLKMNLPQRIAIWFSMLSALRLHFTILTHSCQPYFPYGFALCLLCVCVQTTHCEYLFTFVINFILFIHIACALVLINLNYTVFKTITWFGRREHWAHTRHTHWICPCCQTDLFRIS